jgi:hypothetical protein
MNECCLFFSENIISNQLIEDWKYVHSEKNGKEKGTLDDLLLICMTVFVRNVSKLDTATPQSETGMKS